jgi:hypothetical protein
MVADDLKKAALETLVGTVSVSSQITVLHQVIDMIENSQKDAQNIKTWAYKEIARLEAVRDS